MSNTNDIQQLEIRIVRLERRNRILLTLCISAAMFVAFTAGKRAPVVVNADEVKAKRFILVDDNDREIAWWKSENGYAVLAFDHDQFGNAAALRLAESKDSATINLFQNGVGRVTLSTDKPHGGWLNLVSQGVGSISLTSNAPAFVMNDAREFKFYLQPGNMYSQGPNGRRIWNFSSSALELFGLGIDLRKADGNLIQHLPNKTKPSGKH